MMRMIGVLRTASLAVLLALCGSAPVLAQTQIFPPSGTGGDYVIAVVSDGYAADESWMFDRAVNGLVLSGLMADPFFAAHGSAFAVQKIFHPVPKSGESAFGIRPNYDINRCYIDFDPVNTTTLIDTVVKSVAPERVIVIGNYEGVSLGCTVGSWSYLSAGAREVGGVLEHEFGHLIAGLLDEYALPPNAAYTGAPIDQLNCSNAPFRALQGRGNPAPPQPWWAQLALPNPPANPQGCNYFASRIVRPYEHCRMNSAHGSFCLLCAHELEGALAAYVPRRFSRREPDAGPRLVRAAFILGQPAGPPQPPAPPTTPPGQPPRRDRLPVPSGALQSPGVPSVRVVIELTPIATGVTTTVLTIADVTAPAIQRYRRTGDLVYAMSENGIIFESGVVPGDPFQMRIYGGSAAPHQAGTAPKASVVVMIPNMTRQQLLGRAVAIEFYRLKSDAARNPTGARENITPTMLRDLVTGHEASPYAQLTAVDLKKAAQDLP